MTSGRTSKLIREMDRTLLFCEYVSSKHSNDLIAPTVACSLEFKSGRLLDELLQRKINNHAKQALAQRRDQMKWSHDE